jgi:helix-turn-helix protein
MSVQASSWVWERSRQSGSALLALLAIANHANSEGKNAYPSIQTLADECRMCKRAMRYIVAKIPSSELKVQENAGPRGCNLYELPGVVRDGFHIPGRRRGANFAPSDTGGVGQPGAAEGQDFTLLGAIAVASEPSLTVEPSKTKGKTRAAKPAPRENARFQPFFMFASESFTVKRQRKPFWQGKERNGLRSLLKNFGVESLSLERLQVLWRNFLDSTDPFIVKQSDSLAYFCSNIDKFADGPLGAGTQIGGANGRGKIGSNESVQQTLVGFAANNALTH